MRKRIALLLAAAILFSVLLSGCSEVKDEDPVKNYDCETVVRYGDAGDVVIKQKTYYYDGGNVELVRVENRSGSAFSMILTASYYYDDGRRIFISKKAIDGIPADFTGYFLFDPGYEYSKCELEATLTPWKGETPRENLRLGTDIEFWVNAGDDTWFHPNSTEMYTTYQMLFNVKSKDRDILVRGNLILLDSDGEVYTIYQVAKTVLTNSKGIEKIISFYDVPWSDDYVLPENLQGELHGLAAFDEVTYFDEEEYNKLIEGLGN